MLDWCSFSQLDQWNLKLVTAQNSVYDFDYDEFYFVPSIFAKWHNDFLSELK